jgi:hypothetical protein
MINSEDHARMAIYYRLLDHYLGLPPIDWIGAFRESARQQSTSLLGMIEKQKSARGAGAMSSAEIAAFVGAYRDPIYGTVSIEEVGRQLRIRFEHTPAMTSALAPVGHDSFRTDFVDKRFLDAYATFARAPDGTIERMTLRAFDGSTGFYDDLVFRPIRAQPAQ